MNVAYSSCPRGFEQGITRGEGYCAHSAGHHDDPIHVPRAHPPLAAAPQALTRTQIARLRHYQSRSRYKIGLAINDVLDVDLECLGLITLDRQRHGAHAAVTEAGRMALHRDLQARRAGRTAHDTLASRVALWLQQEMGRLTWENIEFRVDVGPHERRGVRPDVFSVLPVHDVRAIAPMVHECKVSRADFLADLARPEKRAAYAQIAGTVVYVAPEGLIQPDELPTGCGLLVERAPGVFAPAKRVRARRVELSSRALMNLILKSKTGSTHSDALLDAEVAAGVVT